MPAHGPGLQRCAEMLMSVALLLKADANAASQFGLLHASPASIPEALSFLEWNLLVHYRIMLLVLA